MLRTPDDPMPAQWERDLASFVRQERRVGKSYKTIAVLGVAGPSLVTKAHMELYLDLQVEASKYSGVLSTWSDLAVFWKCRFACPAQCTGTITL